MKKWKVRRIAREQIKEGAGGGKRRKLEGGRCEGGRAGRTIGKEGDYDPTLNLLYLSVNAPVHEVNILT